MFYKRFIKKVSDEDGMVQHGDDEKLKNEVPVTSKSEVVEEEPVAASVDSSDEHHDEDHDEHVEVSQGEEDPLGHDYDWDDEKQSEGLPWSTRIESAKEFFNTEILYRYDILEEGIRKIVKGSYRIELKGQNGGVWTLNLGDDISVANKREDAEIVLSMQHGDFLGIVNGEINPQIAILAQKIQITGSIEKALALQGVLAPINS